ncbi:helix-turn-helix domain-containing protein [Frankia sp. Cas4]|uniref:helix-turn-helix domain-containing protein n=1 Tax=Frankia sp. Cas4 TaxID=3073927 RepID=UPI002AD34BA2|nr:helix-turn-helix domain-containing protein [Frankia sp. Cas4]
MRQRSRVRDGTATAEDLLPREIRRRREERGLSRDDLAKIAGYSRQYISQLEQPSRGIPTRPVLAAVDAALAADGALVALRLAAIEARSERMQHAPNPEVESRRRIRDLLDHQTSDRKLDVLDQQVAELIRSADQLTPADITVRVQEQQRSADILLRTRMLPHQQFRLFMIAGHLAGLQAIALLDNYEFEEASTCCLEAAVFTELSGHEGLRTWTLAVNKLIDTAVHCADTAPAFPAPDECAGEATTPRLRIATGTGTDGGGGVRAIDPSASKSDSEDPLIAPGGSSTPPILVAMVRRRVARFAPATTPRTRPPADLSHRFRPPV